MKIQKNYFRRLLALCILLANGCILPERYAI